MRQIKCADGCVDGVCLNLFSQSRCWEDEEEEEEEEEGRSGSADTPGKGTVSQGTGGPVRRRRVSHNPLSGSRTEATGRCWSGPAWSPLPLQHTPPQPPLPPHHYLHRVRVTLSPLGHLPHNPPSLLHCHLSHTGKCLTLFDGCGFPRWQWCTQGQKPPHPCTHTHTHTPSTIHPPPPTGVWRWSGDFCADNLLGAPLHGWVEGNWRGQDILCDAPECTAHQTKTKRAPFRHAHIKITYLVLVKIRFWVHICMCADRCWVLTFLANLLTHFTL